VVDYSVLYMCGRMQAHTNLQAHVPRTGAPSMTSNLVSVSLSFVTFPPVFFGGGHTHAYACMR
jgi:hypothetical protein